MTINKEKILEHIKSIKTHLIEYNPGFDNKEAKSKINNLLNDINYMLGEYSYISEKIVSIEEYVKILYSVRKHEKYGGIKMVKHHILIQLENIEKYLLRL